MAIKVIVELQAKPGRRGELSRLLESIVGDQGPNQQGFLGSTRYEVLDNPDTGAYAPLIDLLAVPFRATVITQLP